MTDIGVQAEMVKEIIAQDWMWYISADAATPEMVSHPGSGLLALLGVSAEVGVVEAQTTGSFSVARSGP